MIIDVTGTILIPGNLGKDCPGNGTNPMIECCCDECDYMLCCFNSNSKTQCETCADPTCPRAGKN